MAFTRFETDTANIIKLSDRPKQNDGLSAAQVKAKFDKAGVDLKTYLNDVLTEELERTTDGDSGADNIGATAVGDGTAETVQGILEEMDANVTALDSAAVHLTGNETIAGVKTFSSSPIVPAPTTDTQASTKKYVDDKDGARKTYVDGLDVLAVHLAGTETITGVKTFNASPVVPTPTTDTQASTKKYVDDADALKVNITDIVNDLTTGGTAVPLSAEQGKTLKGEVGTLASLSTTEKGSLVGAVNEVDSHSDTNATAIGTLASLTTTEKTNLVGAVNELDTDKVETSAIVNTLTETGTGKVLDARQGKTLSDKIGDQTYTEQNYITDAESVTASLDALDMSLELVSTKTNTALATVSLTAAGWVGDNAPYTRTYSNGAITATNPVELFAPPDITVGQLEALQAANIQGGTQSTGSIVLRAFGEKPTIDVPVAFIIRRDL